MASVADLTVKQRRPPVGKCLDLGWNLTIISLLLYIQLTFTKVCSQSEAKIGHRIDDTTSWTAQDKIVYLCSEHQNNNTILSIHEKKDIVLFTFTSIKT